MGGSLKRSLGMAPRIDSQTIPNAFGLEAATQPTWAGFYSLCADHCSFSVRHRSSHPPHHPHALLAGSNGWIRLSSRSGVGAGNNNQEIEAARLRAALSYCIIGTLRDSLSENWCGSEKAGIHADTGDHPDSQWVG
jgi:hypothetical protein